jgi:hypothetical protein
MRLPTYLQRRNGGRFHFQLSLGKALATALGRSHIRISLRTTDSREARRRTVTMLDLTHEFRDAPDLLATGEMLTRKLEALVTAGPPASAQAREDRLIIEDLVANFIRRCRERDAPFCVLPGFVHLFKAFVEQNMAERPAPLLASERAALRTEPAVPRASDVDQLLARLDARLARLDDLARVQPGAVTEPASPPAANSAQGIRLDRRVPS